MKNKIVLSEVEELKIKQEIDLRHGPELWQKIIYIRHRHELGRTLFAKEIGTTENTLKAMEKRGTNPRAEIIQNICRRWPEYTLWFLINEVEPQIGQISPSYKAMLPEYKIDIFNKNDPEHIKVALQIRNALGRLRELDTEIHSLVKKST